MRISFVGDLICQLEQCRAVAAAHLDYRTIFTAVEGLFSASDYVVGNLETPIAGADLRYTYNPAVFNSPAAFAEAIKSLGVDFVSTANNHCLDRGSEGIRRTLSALSAIGLEHSGTYDDKAFSESAFVKEIGGLKIAIVPATYGTNSESGTPLLASDEQWRVDLLCPQVPLKRSAFGKVRHAIGSFVPTKAKQALLAARTVMSGATITAPDYIADNVAPNTIEANIASRHFNRFKRKLSAAKEMADFVIAMPHVGGQYNPGPGLFEKAVVAECKKAGADLIVAGHSHTPLRCEEMDDGTVAAYSLGNFCFTPGAGWYISNVMADYGIVLHVDIDTVSRRIKAVWFSIVKSVLCPDGVARVYEVSDLIVKEQDALTRERLLLDNEVIVNRFRGGAKSVVPERVYEFPIGGNSYGDHHLKAKDL